MKRRNSSTIGAYLLLFLTSSHMPEISPIATAVFPCLLNDESPEHEEMVALLLKAEKAPATSPEYAFFRKYFLSRSFSETGENGSTYSVGPRKRRTKKEYSAVSADGKTMILAEIFMALEYELDEANGRSEKMPTPWWEKAWNTLQAKGKNLRHKLWPKGKGGAS